MFGVRCSVVLKIHRIAHLSALPRAQCRRCLSEALGARRAQGEAGKRPQPIHRGEFVLCDPRRPQTTTGASVRLTCVAQVHPYSPRQRAQREYERRPFSRLAQWASDRQCRRCVEAAAAQTESVERGDTVKTLSEQRSYGTVPMESTAPTLPFRVPSAPVPAAPRCGCRRRPRSRH